MTNRSVAVESIEVGQRRREDYGDVDSLSRSIEQYGLLHPIVVDDMNRLVAGGRRLDAVKRLGWTYVEVRSLGDLNDAERIEIELEENLRRKDLTQFERSKTLIRLAEQATEIQRQEPARNPRGFLPTMGEKAKIGRPTKPDSEERVSQRIGVPRQTISRARQHVASVDRYPELAPIPQVDAVKIARKLDEMPLSEREQTREAVKRHEPDTLARLTDRPPLPVGPTPHQMAANDPGHKFTKDFHELVVRLNAMRDAGGVPVAVRTWRAEVKAVLLADIVRVIDIATGWRRDLEGEIGHVNGTDDAGSVRERDEGRVVGDDRRPEAAA